jgi:hypothetical protein
MRGAELEFQSQDLREKQTGKTVPQEAPAHADTKADATVYQLVVTHVVDDLYKISDFQRFFVGAGNIGPKPSVNVQISNNWNDVGKVVHDCSTRREAYEFACSSGGGPAGACWRSGVSDR